MSGIPTLSRLMPVRSALNAPCGLHVEPKLPGQVLSVTYSFSDTAGKYSPQSNPIASRIAIIAGRFGDLLSNFTLATDLSTYRVLFDLDISDPGPTPIIIPPDAEDGIGIETDGITALLAAPVVTGVTGTLFVAKLHLTSKGLVTQVNSRLKQTEDQSGVQSATTSTSSSGSTGGVSEGGPVSGGGGQRVIRPL